MGISYRQVGLGVYHILESMGVCVTLIVGGEGALLFDTGYGLDDRLPLFVRSLTDRPLTVVNSHGHYDHTCGNFRFEEVFITAADMPICRESTGRPYRRALLDRAKGLGEAVDDEEAYLAAGPGRLRAVAPGVVDLGGTTVELIALPGHTPGSLVGLIMPQRILLAGDNWNPATWLFFEEALPALAYAQAMRGLLPLPFDFVLAPHVPELIRGERVRRYIRGLTEEALQSAVPIVIAGHESIPTYACQASADATLIFDYGKHAAIGK